jgi:hypothetical protein
MTLFFAGFCAGMFAVALVVDIARRARGGEL